MQAAEGGEERCADNPGDGAHEHSFALAQEERNHRPEHRRHQQRNGPADERPGHRPSGGCPARPGRRPAEGLHHGGSARAQAWPSRQPTGQPARQAEEEATPQPEEQGPSGPSHYPGGHLVRDPALHQQLLDLPAHLPPGGRRRQAQHGPGQETHPEPAHDTSADDVPERQAHHPVLRAALPLLAEEPRDGRRREAVDETVEEWPPRARRRQHRRGRVREGPDQGPDGATRAPRPSPKASRSTSV